MFYANFVVIMLVQKVFFHFLKAVQFNTSFLSQCNVTFFLEITVSDEAIKKNIGII